MLQLVQYHDGLSPLLSVSLLIVRWQ
jgi:hypothetical protein